MWVPPKNSPSAKTSSKNKIQTTWTLTKTSWTRITQWTIPGCLTTWVTMIRQTKTPAFWSPGINTKSTLANKTRYRLTNLWMWSATRTISVTIRAIMSLITTNQTTLTTTIMSLYPRLKLPDMRLVKTLMIWSLVCSSWEMKKIVSRIMEIRLRKMPKFHLCFCRNMRLGLITRLWLSSKQLIISSKTNPCLNSTSCKSKTKLTMLK